ncbi:MAG: helix-turn-helix domain-containing protein [Fusicatenibacter sp.]|nr:helix-turn-helix domain-containing protein [Fusicatenibacter sp.]
MEKNYIRSDSIVELEFLSERKTGIHYHENIELLFLMSGNMTVTVEGEEFPLESGDMIVVNANRNHSYEGPEGLFIGRFILSYSKISELLDNHTVIFWCNSSLDQNKAYDELRFVISRIFYQFLNEEKGKKQGKLYLNSLYYQMLAILTGNFLLTEKDAKYEQEKGDKDDRVQEIFSYIRMNFRHNISLHDIADQLYLSETYISKYIKKKCNSSFIELVNSVRFGHAMEDLIYTDASIMKIAMDNGFASVAAFNKVFKNTYGTTPSDFRKNMRKKRRTEQDRLETHSEEIHEKIEAYLVKNPLEENEERYITDMDVLVNADEDLGTWENHFGRMINAGTAKDLLRTVFQEQIPSMREKLGIEYVRFWDIYDPELLIDIHAPKEQLNFGRLDAVIDFLIKNHMKPYMELGFKPLRLLKNTQAALKEESRDSYFTSEDEMWNFYHNMIRHFVKRYGSEEVETWYFEYWEKEETQFQNLSYQFTPLSESEHENYFCQFDVLANALRSCIPGVKIGGGGFPLQHYGEMKFTQMLKNWKNHREKPDFISISCYPYQQEKEGNIYYEKRSTDIDFVKHNLEMAKRAIGQTAFPVSDVHVTEYSMSLSNRNAMNDSCMKGAFLMRNAISCIGQTKVLGHWLFSDTYADFNDSQSLLFGGCGLLTKNGIPKPGLYAFAFMKRLYKRIVAIDEHYLITENERGSFRMVCHNFKKPNYNYYMTQEDKIQIRDLSQMMDDREYLTIHLKIENVKNGVYLIKQKRINQNYGSIQDEWNRLNTVSELTMEEMEYLNKINEAKLTIQEVKSVDQKLEFDIMMEPNEIQHLYMRWELPLSEEI